MLVKKEKGKKKLPCCLLSLKKWHYPVFKTLGAQIVNQSSRAVPRLSPAVGSKMEPTAPRYWEVNTCKSLKQRLTVTIQTAAATMEINDDTPFVRHELEERLQLCILTLER